MHTLNIIWTCGRVERIACTESDANRAAAELSARADVVRAWVESQA